MCIKIVSATRGDKSSFARTPLGQSVQRIAALDTICLCITFQNTRGLPEVYNEAINSGADDEILVFIHDDVWIDDYWFTKRIEEGLRLFDVIGVAGNTRLPDEHVAWAFKNPSMEWDHPHLSGRVAHGNSPFGTISVFGDAPKECNLLDGLFLAAKCSTLKKNHIRFDENFQWHFYDLDFCRSASAAGLKLATWPITLTHTSGGSFGSQSWQSALRQYKQKYPERRSPTISDSASSS